MGVGRSAIVAALVLAFAGAPAPAGPVFGYRIDSTWVGGYGAWDDPSNWDPPIVPNNNTYKFDVNIDGTPTLDMSVEVSSLLIDGYDPILWLMSPAADLGVLETFELCAGRIWGGGSLGVQDAVIGGPGPVSIEVPVSILGIAEFIGAGADVAGRLDAPNGSVTVTEGTVNLLAPDNVVSHLAALGGVLNSGTNDITVNWQYETPQLFLEALLGGFMVRGNNLVNRPDRLTLLSNTKVTMFNSGDPVITHSIPVVVTGDSALEALTPAALPLGEVTLEEGITLATFGAPIHFARTILGGGAGGINNSNDVDIGLFDDGGTPRTFRKTGPGTLTVDNTTPGSIVADHTTWEVLEGVLRAVGLNVLGGAGQVRLEVAILRVEGDGTSPFDGLGVDFTVAGNGTLDAVTSSTAAFGEVTLEEGATLITYGAVMHLARTFFVGSTAGINNSNDVDIGLFDDGGVPRTFRKTGPGTLTVDNTIPGSIVADHTTWEVLDGTLRAVGPNVLGGAGQVRLEVAILQVEGDGTSPFDGLGVDFTVGGNSTIDAVTASTASFGTLRFETGTLTTSGAAGGMSFTNTVIADGADAGIDAQTETLLTATGGLDGTGVASARLAKTGPADVICNQPGVNLDQVLFDLLGGDWVAVDSDAFGAGRIRFDGGNAWFSSTGGPASFANSLTLSKDALITAGVAGGGVPGQTVDLGSPGLTIDLGGNTLSLRARDGYTLKILSDVTGPGDLEVLGGKANFRGATGGDFDVWFKSGAQVGFEVNGSVRNARVSGTASADGVEVEMQRLTVDSPDGGVEAWNKAGVMVRDSLSNSGKVSLFGSTLTVGQGLTNHGTIELIDPYAGGGSEVTVLGAVYNNGYMIIQDYSTFSCEGSFDNDADGDIDLDDYSTLQACIGAPSAPKGAAVPAGDGGTMSNAGDVWIGTGSLLSVNGTYVNTGTTTLAQGTLAAAAIHNNGGVLAGEGTILGDVTNAGGTTPGLSPGALTIEGDFVQTAAGLLEIEFGPAGSDQLIVAGTATLGGALEVVLLPGAAFSRGDFFDILIAQSVVGRFATEALPTDEQGQPFFSLTYGPGGLELEALRDSAGPGPDVIPEPMTMVLLGLGGAGLLLKRRRA